MNSTVKKVFAALAMTAAATVGISATYTASAAEASPSTVESSTVGSNTVGSTVGSNVAARSTQVLLNNWSQCELDLSWENLDHGVWGTFPPSHITNSTWGVWLSESNGLATGTQGTVIYQARFCGNPANENRFVEIDWNNPFAGSNSYGASAGGTMHVTKLTSGSGNNAVVQFRVDS